MCWFKTNLVAITWNEPYRSYVSFDGSKLRKLEKTKVEWNSTTGFQILEPAMSFGWLIEIYDSKKMYYYALRGRNSYDVYLISTDTVREFVSDYSEISTWHSRGAFRVNGKLFDELINEIKKDG